MTIKTKIQWLLILLGLCSIVVAIYVCIWACFDTKTIFQALGIVIAFNFFMYKMLTGWLFINLTVKIEPERQKAGKVIDDLAINLTLSKGNIDSVWLQDIQIRICEVTLQRGAEVYTNPRIIRPIGFKKMEPIKDNYWTGTSMPHYVISLSEAVPFSAYTQVKKDAVIAAEVLILGTRPFYNAFTFWKNNLIQWRSSVIILPKV